MPDRVEEALRRAFDVTPDPGARARTRARLLAKPFPARERSHRRLVTVLAAALLVPAGGGAALVPLSAHALPGDPLYGVRMATERIRIALASSSEDEAMVRLSVARARTADIEGALASGRTAAVGELARRFFEQLRAVRETAQGLDAMIAARLARLDEISDEAERSGGGRRDRVVRDLRRHDDREDRDRNDHRSGDRDQDAGDVDGRGGEGPHGRSG